MSENKKIFILVGSFKAGGTERTASRIGLELLRRGYRVKFLLVNNVFDYDIPDLRRHSVALNPADIKNRIAKLICVFVRMFLLTWKERPHRLISFSLGLNLFAFFVGYPRTVFRVESNMFIYRRQPHKRYLQRLFVLFPHVRWVVIPSAGLAEACRNYFLAYSKRKILQIDNPIDLEEVERLSIVLPVFPPKMTKKYFISAGRLAIGKGFEQLIEIYKKSSLYPEYSLLILGKGPMMDELAEIIDKNSLRDRVFLLGHVSNPYAYFSRASFFILNSSHESFGNVLIEAMACGTPVISNDCDFGPRHIISDGYNGYLYDKRDESGFVSLMNSLGHGDNLQRLVNNLNVSVQRFSVHRVADIWIETVL